MIGSAAQLLAAKWSAARRSWRSGDAGVLATQVLRRTLRPVAVWQKLIFFEKDLADEVPPVRSRVPLEMHVVGGDALAAHRAAIEAEGLDWEKMAARAALGHRCTIVLSAGRLVHIRWHTDAGAWIPELRATLRPPPGDAYVYDAFTPEDLRGGQVQPAVACLMMEWGRREGYRRHHFYVRGNNAPGLRIVSKMRVRRTAVVRCLRSKDGRDAWVTGLRRPGAPHLDFGAATRVRSLGPLGLWISERP